MSSTSDSRIIVASRRLATRVRTHVSDVVHMRSLEREYGITFREGFRISAIAYGFLAVAALVVGSTWSQPADIPWWIVGVIGVFSYWSGYFTQERGDAIAVTFGHLFALTTIAVYGFQWPVIVAATVATALTARKYPMGYWNSLHNGSLLMIQLVVVSAAFELLRSGIPFEAAVVGLVVVDVAVNILLLTFAPVEAGSDWRRTLRSLMQTEWRDALFTTPLLLVTSTAMLISPVNAFIGLTGLIVLVHVSTQVEEQLVFSERKRMLDSKTGLRNAAAFWDSVALLAETADRSSRTLGVMMIDIDNFKILNDTRGHLEGDEALIAVASAIAGAVRAEDVAARFGGEEFALAIPGLDEPELLEVAERVRVACRSALEPWGTSVSIGVSNRPAMGPAPDACLEAADKGLYAAKRGGKDRVVFEPCGEAVAADRPAAA